MICLVFVVSQLYCYRNTEIGSHITCFYNVVQLLFGNIQEKFREITSLPCTKAQHHCRLFTISEVCAYELMIKPQQNKHLHNWKCHWSLCWCRASVFIISDLDFFFFCSVLSCPIKAISIIGCHCRPHIPPIAMTERVAVVSHIYHLWFFVHPAVR